MNMIRIALRKPFAVMVVVIAIGFFSFLVVKKINVDMLKLARHIERLTGDKLVYEA